MRNYEIVESTEDLKHRYRCEDDDGHIIDDYTGQRVKCPKCNCSMVLRYDYNDDHAYMMCMGNFIHNCDFTQEIAISTARCRTCGEPTVLRTRGLGGRIFLSCPKCTAKGIRNRIQIGNAVFSDR